jgi:GT2 family glycosyltransferase
MVTPRPDPGPGPVETAVVTVVRGTHEALERLHGALGEEPDPPQHLIVLAVDDDDLLAWDPEGVPVEVIPISRREGEIPWGAAKNAGATAALQRGARAVVFVAPDARFEPGTIAALAAAAGADDGVWWAAGPDGEKPGDQPGDQPAPEDLDDAAFSVSLGAWGTTRGFCEEYVGPGWEDLDLARLAVGNGLALGVAPGAVAHRDGSVGPHGDPADGGADDASLLRNGDLHHSRWGTRPPAYGGGGW